MNNPFSFKKEKKNKKEKNSETLNAEEIYLQGLATIKDLIAPASFSVSPSRLRVGNRFSRTLFIIAYPRYLQTGWLSPVINLDKMLDVSIFVHPVETGVILKSLRKTATQIQSRINLETQAGKIRDPVLETSLQDIEDLRDRLQQGVERFFRAGFYITAYGETEKELNDLCSSIESLLEARLVYLKPAVFRMEQGFASTIPIANDELDASTNLNTSPLSTSFPFTSSNLSSNSGILYGINRHNNSLVLFDRFKMENANMVVFAKSGAGKSYTAKLEILRSLMFGAQVIVVDPENEYKHLCDAVGGSFIKISLTSPNHINPFDLPVMQEDDSPEEILRSGIVNILGLMKIVMGNITPEEDSILDKAIKETYAVKDITPTSPNFKTTSQNPPNMSLLYDVLRNMSGGEDLATRLEKYTEGTFAGFLNKFTNVRMDTQLVVFNIRDMEEVLRPVAMYLILQYIWNQIRSTLKKRLLVVDEAWIMMAHEDAGNFMFRIAKRCRKYFTGLTTITQDVSDFINSPYGKPIITNSSIQLLLKQSPASIDIVSETFYLTEQEKMMLLESKVGEGIFFAGLKHAAIRVVASYTEDQIITSDPAQLIEIAKAKKELSGH
jgi:conjugal transfer ATP-binding protein TraC